MLMIFLHTRSKKKKTGQFFTLRLIRHQTFNIGDEPAADEAAPPWKILTRNRDNL